MPTKYLQTPNDEQRENARKGVNSSKESVKQDVQHLIEWFEKQPHLPNIRDEEVLAHCLLNCKNSLEKTKGRLEMYYTTRAAMPEIFRNRNPFEKELEMQTKRGMFVPMRKLTPDGYRVVFLYLSDSVKTETDSSTIEDFFKINQMTVDVMGKLDYPKGVIVVHDGKNITMPLVAAFSSYIQKLILLTQKTVPVRYKKLYFCNMGQAGELLLAIAKNMLKKSLASRIEILKNPTDISRILPKDIIPRDYGGDDLPLEELTDLWYEELKNQHEFLKLTEKHIADLTKAPKDYTETDLSGVNGSFRQISID